MTGRVAHVLQVDKATLWRYDDTRQALIPLLPAFGFLDEHLRAIEVEVEKGEWAHDLLFHDATIRSNNVPQERDGALYKQLRDWNIASILAVPLIAHGQPVGIFCAYDKQENAPSRTRMNRYSARLRGRRLSRFTARISMPAPTPAANKLPRLPVLPRSSTAVWNWRPSFPPFCGKRAALCLMRGRGWPSTRR